jgi:hypothetical protein
MGVSLVIQAIIENKKPLIVHNCMYATRLSDKDILLVISTIKKNLRKGIIKFRVQFDIQIVCTCYFSKLVVYHCFADYQRVREKL